MTDRKLFQWLIVGTSVIYVITTPLLIAAMIVYRFQNPALTETQLFLAFWPYWIVFIIVSLALGYAWKRWMG